MLTHPEPGFSALAPTSVFAVGSGGEHPLCTVMLSLPGLQASAVPPGRDDQKWLLGAELALFVTLWVRGIS